MVPVPVEYKRRRGFTLVELLIVIVVIAILALIIIPRLMSANRQARESVLKTNLHDLRLAIAHFEADTGVSPAGLDDLVLPLHSPPTAGVGGANIPAGTYQGPYLTTPGGGIGGGGIPINPFTSPTSDSDVTHHWDYDTSNGTVTVPASMQGLVTLGGQSFSSL